MMRCSCCMAPAAVASFPTPPPSRPATPDGPRPPPDGSNGRIPGAEAAAPLLPEVLLPGGARSKEDTGVTRAASGGGRCGRHSASIRRRLLIKAPQPG